MTFEAEVIHALSGLLDVAGTAPKYGTLTVTVGATEFSSPLSATGEFYFEDLPPGDHPGIASWGSHTCRATIHMPDKAPADDGCRRGELRGGREVTPARSLTVALLALAVLMAALTGRRGAVSARVVGRAGRQRPRGNLYDRNAAAELWQLRSRRRTQPSTPWPQVIYTCNNQAKKIRIEMTTGHARD